jgi:signal peptide peptidase SppA
MIDYIGDTSKVKEGARWSTDTLSFVPPSDAETFWTRFNLWRQYPWKKIGGKVVLKAKIGGELPLEPSPKGFAFGAVPDFEPVESLQECMNMFNYGAYDPRVKSIILEIDRLGAGYAKLTELKRSIALFRDSGKKVYAYCSGGAEKELFVALGCDALYVPPDGGLDLRGFSAAATFVRGVFEKIGIEPQVQRIGKYKSFGDTFNRTEIAEAQREVTSSLLTEASDFWVDTVSESLGVSKDDVLKLWKDSGIKSPDDFRDLGFITGVKYLDQVEVLVRKESSDETKIDKPSMSDKMMMKKKSDAINSTIDGVDFTNETTIYTSALGAIKTEVDDYIADFGLSKDFETNKRRSLENFTMSTAEAEGLVAKRKIDAKNSTLVAEVKAAKMQKMKEKKEAMATEGARKFFESKLVNSWPRVLPAGLYLRKMRKGSRILKGLRMKEARGGERVAVINAIGGINPGKSGNGPNGRSLGSDTVIKLVRRARADPGIKALVLRIDSPGGSALASDLMWRELRALAEEKPVIASQVDVAASGGYYLSMACDAIFAEELTVTGSVGVVTAKFNTGELNDKLGVGTETISRGRFAEVLSSNRGFTEDEEAYFEEGAQKAYTSFITKAAASRSFPSVEAMNEVAQGRVWTGRQALNNGLVDRMGGLWAAARAAAHLADIDVDSNGLNLQVLAEPRSGFPIPGVGASAFALDDVDYFMDDCVMDTGLVSTDSMGVPPALKSLGVSALAAHLLRKSGLLSGLSLLYPEALGTLPSKPSIKGMFMSLEDIIDEL